MKPRKRKRQSIAVTIAFLMLTSTPAYAVTGLFSGETQLLASILVQELKQVASMVETIARLKMLVAGVNDVAAATRAAVRMAHAVATFKPERLLADMQAVVWREFPEARELANELGDLHGNVTSLGSHAFWKRYTPADYRMDQLAEKTARFAIRSSALNLVGPIVDVIDPTDTDELLERYHRESKTALQRAFRHSAWGQFVQRLKVHDEEAQANRNLGAQVDAMGAAGALEGAKNTAEHLDIEKARTARGQAQREYDVQLERKLVEKGMKEGELMRPAILGGGNPK